MARGGTAVQESTTIIGRDKEVQRLGAMVDDVVDGIGGTLVVEGPTGSGRTAVVGAALADARPDLVVVRASGGVDEHVLAYAVLGDLCRPFLDLLDELPAVQAAALRGALALGPPTGDRLAVAAGFLSLLHLQSTARPVLVVVDDADLLDDGTATAVAFAARRLAGFAAGIVVVQDPSAPTSLALPDADRLVLDLLADDDARAIARLVAPDADPVVVAELVAVADGLPGRLIHLLTGAGRPTRPIVLLDDELVARRAAARGSHADEAAAYERAERWSPAASAWLAACDADRAIACLDHAEAQAANDAEVAAVLALRGRADILRGRGRRARAALERAADLAEGAGDRVLAARCTLLALPLLVHTGELGAAPAALDRARRLLAGTPAEAGLHRLLLAAETAVALAAGDDADPEALVELAETGFDDPDLIGPPWVVTTVALPLIWAERYRRARQLLERIVAVGRRRGAMGVLPLPLAALAVLERRQGSFDRALIAATEARHLAASTGQRGAELWAISELANVFAQRGDVERCRDAATAVLADAASTDATVVASARSALATVELWLGRWDAVIALLEPVVASSTGRLGPVVTMYHQNLLTAYVFAGRHDDARALLPALEAQAATSERVRCVLERCRGLLAPAGAYDDHFRRAVDAAPTSFARGLSLLFHATRLADDGRHAEAIATLTELATATTDGLVGIRRAAGTVLARLGVDLAAEPRAAGTGDLDPIELSVAFAAADGTPVPTIADSLLLSPPEVELLRDRAYRSLSVTSADELRQRLPAPRARTAGPLIRLLGGLAVDSADGQRTPPAGAPTVALAAIALRRSMHVEELGDLLWPDAPSEVAKRRLRNVLSRIRRSVGEVVERHGERVSLAPGTTVDVHEVDAIATRLATGVGTAADLERALRLCRGPLLPELVYEDWTAPDRDRLEDLEEELRAVRTEPYDASVAVLRR